ncbi:MAG: hypothetical protein MZW92_78370 [Comamonadaceae bacterium]|nr:hypothetical protein [Comamonadaceae bacterium]
MRSYLSAALRGRLACCVPRLLSAYRRGPWQRATTPAPAEPDPARRRRLDRTPASRSHAAPASVPSSCARRPAFRRISDLPCGRGRRGAALVGRDSQGRCAPPTHGPGRATRQHATPPRRPAADDAPGRAAGIALRDTATATRRTGRPDAHWLLGPRGGARCWKPLARSREKLRTTRR